MKAPKNIGVSVRDRLTQHAREEKAVALTGYTPISMSVPSPIEPHFAAPESAPSLTFGPVELAAAAARAATTRNDAPVAVLDALQRSTLPMLQTMIEDGPRSGTNLR